MHVPFLCTLVFPLYFLNHGGILAIQIGQCRNGTDLDYEMTMYGINRAVEGVDTIFIPAKQEYMHISSTFVREMLRYEHDFTGLVPAPVHRYLCEEWMK